MKKWTHKLNRGFSKEEVQMASRCKKCSTYLVIKDIQIKPTLRFHLIPVRMAIIKDNNNNKCWRGRGKTGTLIHCWWECRLMQPVWKTVWRFLKKLEIEILYNPVVLLLGIYPKECKAGYSKDLYTDVQL
jgi:hypothetical protein